MPFKTREAKRKEQAKIFAQNKWGKGLEHVVKEELALNLSANISDINARIKDQIAKEGTRHLE